MLRPQASLVCTISTTLMLVLSPVVHAQVAERRPTVPLETYEQWVTELSNWGRWGAEDELGTLNLVTPAKRQQAAALVQTGITVSLARPMVKGSNALQYKLFVLERERVSWALDSLAFMFHGSVFSHIDGLAHTLYRNRLYNGYGQGSLAPDGTTKLGIDVISQGIVTRGVLVDIPRLRGVPYLEPSTVITPEELEEWERRQGMRIEAGDVLLVRTGRWARVQVKGTWEFGQALAGLHPSVAHFLKARGVAALGSDGVNEAFPSLVPGLSNPLHQLTLVALGMPLFDNLDLEAVAQEAAQRNRPTFLFIAVPLRIPGGTGSPLNPLAVF